MHNEHRLKETEPQDMPHPHRSNQEAPQEERPLLYIPPGSKRNIVMWGLMISTFANSILSYSLTTLLPSISADLNGQASYALGLVLSLVGIAVAIPLSGYFSRRFSVRNVLIMANLCSLLSCGVSYFSRSFGMYIFFYLLLACFFMGINFAVGPIAISMIFEKKTAAYWMSVSGLLLCASQLAAPILMGAIADLFGWRATMLAMLPFLLIGSLLLLPMPKTKPERDGISFDWAGLILMTAALLAFSFVTRTKGVLAFALFALTVLLAVLFLRVERGKGQRAMFPLAIFRELPLMLPLFFAALFARSAVGVFRTFLPPFVQEVMGRSATEVGITMACAAAIGVFLSVPVGKAMIRTGKIAGVLSSGALVCAGCLTVFLLFVTPGTPIWAVWILMLVFSHCSMLTNNCYVVAAQLTLPNRYLAEGLVAVQFGQLLGSTLGSAVNGIIVRAFPTLYLGVKSAVAFDYLICLGLVVSLFLLVRRLKQPAEEQAEYGV